MLTHILPDSSSHLYLYTYPPIYLYTLYTYFYYTNSSLRNIHSITILTHKEFFMFHLRIIYSPVHHFSFYLERKSYCINMWPLNFYFYPFQNVKLWMSKYILDAGKWRTRSQGDKRICAFCSFKKIQITIAPMSIATSHVTFGNFSNKVIPFFRI